MHHRRMRYLGQRLYYGWFVLAAASWAPSEALRTPTLWLLLALAFVVGMVLVILARPPHSQGL